MRKPNILLISRIPFGAQSDLLPLLRSACTVHSISRYDQISDKVQDEHPVIFCFEYDYPDTSGLITLKKSRMEHPSAPVLMVTKNSSEALAIWALRARVWDYLVKPVKKDDLLERIQDLYNLISRRDKFHSRRPHLPASCLPTDVHGLNLSGPRALRGVVSYIERNLNAKISQHTVADACGMSSYKFSRSFKQMYGVTFQDYLTRQRLKAATRLLRDTGASISDVCYSTGFNDMSHFGRTFRRHLGMTPSRYKRTSQHNR
jgi:YesN/AraC family two-component response regulator